jgi:hypothetical protein
MKITAKILALYIFLGSLLPGTDYGQFLHIEDLLQHVQLHKLEATQLGETFSWQHFVYDHFINPDHHEHSQHTDHSELPFHTIHTTVVVWASAATYLEVKPDLVPISAEQTYLNPFHLEGFQTRLIEPPSIG